MTASPRLTSAQDQAEATDRDVRQHISTFLGGTDSEVSSDEMHPLIREKIFHPVVDDIGEMRLCRHIREMEMSGPFPFFWFPWLPGQFNCADCQADETRASGIEDSPENNRCDLCGVIEPKGLHLTSIILPSLVVEVKSGVRTLGPLVMGFGMCNACSRAVEPPSTGKQRPTTWTKPKPGARPKRGN